MKRAAPHLEHNPSRWTTLHAMQSYTLDRATG